MNISARLHKLYHALLAVESEVTSTPAAVGQGICSLLHYQLGRDYYGTTGLIKGLASTWKGYSGSSLYPVPSGSYVSAPSAFWNWPRWSGEYGASRLSLLQHMIKEVRELRSFALMAETIVNEVDPYVVRRLHVSLAELRQRKLEYPSGGMGICISLDYSNRDSRALFLELISKYASCANRVPDYVVPHPSMSASDAYFQLNNLWDYNLGNDDGCYARRRMFLLNLLCEVTDNADPYRGTSLFDINPE